MSQANKTIYNRTNRSKTSLEFSNSFEENIKCTLIVLPPNDLQNENELSFSNKKYSTKQFAFQKFNFHKNDDEEL